MLYFGTKERWSKKKSIKELLQIPEHLDEFVNDYKINVIEVAWLSDNEPKMFKSDFGIVANFFVQKRKNKNYVPDDKREIQHVDAVLKLLSVMTGDNVYENILYHNNEKKAEVKTMCEVADHLKKMGKNEGLLEGKREGHRTACVENAKNFFQNGASYELVRMSIKELSDEELNAIYKDVTGKEIEE